MPFGEVIPFRGLISHITSLTSLQPVNMTPGHRAVVFRVGRIRLGDVICYEVGFDGLVRSEVAAGANLLSAQSNDATFEVDGQTGESLQQLAMAQIRAVEFDRSVVVASTTGVSAIIAPDGRLIARSGTWQRAVLEARVPLLSGRTLAERVGAWPEYVITALTVLALIAAAAGAVAARRRLGPRRCDIAGAPTWSRRHRRRPSPSRRQRRPSPSRRHRRRPITVEATPPALHHRRGDTAGVPSSRRHRRGGYRAGRTGWRGPLTLPPGRAWSPQGPRCAITAPMA